MPAWSSWIVPSSIAAVAQPESTSPTCSTLQRDAPTLGPTCTDHFHPGWYVARPMVMPPMRTSSNFPFSKVRTSSGSSKRFNTVSSADIPASRLSQIEQAEPRHAEKLEHALLRVLPFELRQLLGRHFTPIRRERAIHFSANGEKLLLVGIGGERRGEFLFEHGKAALEVFEVKRPGRIEQRRYFFQPFGGVFQARRKRRVRGSLFFRGAPKPL